MIFRTIIINVYVINVYKIQFLINDNNNVNTKTIKLFCTFDVVALENFGVTVVDGSMTITGETVDLIISVVSVVSVVAAVVVLFSSTGS